MKPMAFLCHSAARTHQGNVRGHNEDSCLDRGDKGLWVVADGMGGHESGDYASQLIVERLNHVRDFERPSQFVDFVEDQLLGINQHLYDKSMASEQPTVIGSTVVALLAFDRFGVVTWAGDSRLYLLRHGDCSRVSHDHSEVEELVRQGLVKPEDAESHPKANVITRAVGGAQKLYLDTELIAIEVGDRFLLCSDGLYKDLSEQEIGLLLGKGDARQACDQLIDVALSRQCSDNVTAVVVEFAGDPDASAERSRGGLQEGLQEHPPGVDDLITQRKGSGSQH